MIAASYVSPFRPTPNVSAVLKTHPSNSSIKTNISIINRTFESIKESPEAQNIDIILSEKFSKMAFDLDTPPVTAIGRLFDKLIRFFTGAKERAGSLLISQGETEKNQFIKRNLNDEPIQIGDTTIFIITNFPYQQSALKYKTSRASNDLSNILQEILPMFEPLGYENFLFKTLPLPANSTNSTSGMCFGQNYIFYDTNNERASLLVFSLKLGDNCQLFEQQLDCINQHLGVYFSMYSESIDFPEFYSSNISFPNSTHKKTFTQPSPIRDANWTLSVSAYQNESFPPGPPKNMSPAFLAFLQKQFEALPACEREVIDRQKLHFNVNVGLGSSAAAVAIVISAIFIAKRCLRNAQEPPLLEPLIQA